MKGLATVALLGMMLAPALTAAVAQDAPRVHIQVQGSTTVGPIADAFKEAIERQDRNVSITVNKTGSGDGAAALTDSRCDIATMSRFMHEKEFKDAVAKGVLPVAHAVAMDGVCVILNPANTVTGLTIEQLRDIYAGRITHWSQVGGPNLAIVPISRDTSSGTYETFHELVMNRQKMAQNVEYVSSNPQAKARVETTSGAVAYVGLGFVDAKVRALQVNGVTPTRKTIASGTYPVSRPLFMFTNGYPTLGSPLHRFCTFHLTEAGQDIIEDKGFVPLTDY
ncbi:MAG: phosphate ABC transporter substrate-binding protein [Planctomycetes bacterium]|nr:phosphate ABC transporter substrate-binding protein [Planctomycetota bacterium]